MDWQVSEITENQAADLVTLFSNSGPFVAARQQSDYWLYARLFRQYCLCVIQKSRIIGAILAFQDQTPGVKELYIQDVAVADEYRGKGIATALMDGIHEKADSADITRIWLTSESANREAIRLWKRHGYQNQTADYQENDLWVTRDLKGPGKDRIVFSRTPVKASDTS